MDMKPLYEGKAKQIFPADEPDHYVMRFKDAASAFDGIKKATIEQKGALNQKISARIFSYLRDHGVESHFVRSINERDMMVRAVEILLVEVVVRNIAAGSLCKRLGIEEKKKIEPPLVEFFYKSDPLHDPLITEDHIQMMKLAKPEEVAFMRKRALRVNELLQKYFHELGIVLVDFKLEFGRDSQGKLLLADEITPDGCRLWDAKTMKILDKDRFRKDLGGLTHAYQDVLDRIEKTK